MIAVETPRPLHGAGAEHERAAVVTIERQAVRRRPEADMRTEVDDLLHVGHRRRRQPHQAGGLQAVLERFAPLVAQRVAHRGLRFDRRAESRRGCSATTADPPSRRAR